MARDVDGRHGPLGVALSASHWRHFSRPCLDEEPVRLVDELVVGPSGVHLVVHTGVTGVTAADTTALTGCTAVASRAVEVVAALLPDRYRPAVRPLVCACLVRDAGLVVDTVPVLAPDACRHTLVHAPRVLSTSEVQRVAGLLQAVLAPEPGVRPLRRARSRMLWWSVGAAAAVSGVAAATSGVAAAVSASLPW